MRRASSDVPTCRASAHPVRRPLAPRRELAGRGYKVPNGGLFSTVGDLARFLAFEMGNGPEAVLQGLRSLWHYHHDVWSFHRNGLADAEHRAAPAGQFDVAPAGEEPTAVATGTPASPSCP